MHRIGLAFRAFFSLLFSGVLAPDVIAELGLSSKPAAPVKTAPPPSPPKANASDGALQILGILQRDGRLLDFFLEDIGSYTDEQVGNAVRGVHAPVKQALDRYFKFAPVIDGVEGAYTKAPGRDGSQVKFLGNVPPSGADGGVLRHRGWQVTQVQFPNVPDGLNLRYLAPAELEVE